MKKIYTAPVLDVVEFNVSNIIATSEIPRGGDVSNGSIEAPRRNAIWDD